MTLVVDLFRTLIPTRAKASPSGWTSFNAPCCGHRGHAADTRKRGGLRFESGVNFNCFNCKYTANWKPGRPISDKFKSLCKWLGAPDDLINQMIFEALKAEAPTYVHVDSPKKVEFTPKPLPEGSLLLSEWIQVNDLEVEEKIVPVIDYLLGRGLDPLDKNFYWTPEPGFNNRVIIPFRYKGAIVGNTARKVTHGRPKYVSDQHPHFVFNLDAQKEEHKYVFVLEGPFDALSVGGVGVLTNDIAEQQRILINGLGQEVIVIPDQDKAGLVLITRAIEYGWSVAFPNWEDDIKDSADAVLRYGKLFVIVDAIKTAQRGEIKITMARNKLEAKLKRLENVEENN
jgi:hypothetical protein